MKYLTSFLLILLFFSSCSDDDENSINNNDSFLKISFPEEFTRQNVDKFYIMLSDKNGEYLDHKSYSDKEEIIEFDNNLVDDDSEYMLTFFEVFENSIFNVFCYSNLTRDKLGNIITFEERSLNSAPGFVNLDLTSLNLRQITNAAGSGYSMVNINNILTGHTTTSYTNDLGSNKTLIKSFNNSIPINYQWSLINNIENITQLSQEDFSTENVINETISFSTNVNNPMLRLYGFENDDLYNAFCGHDLYHSRPPREFGNSYQYAFPNIFNKYFYSLKANNYYIQGLGTPSKNNFVPNNNVIFSVSENFISFQGVNGYEVGRVRLTIDSEPGVLISPDNPSILMEFIFDGNNNEVIVPKIPQGLFSDSVYQSFIDYKFKPIQAVAENYSEFLNYSDYLKNVLATSKPFYLTSGHRERIFTSKVSPHILPIWEFPYLTRF